MHGVQLEGSDIAALIESIRQRGPDPHYRIPGEAALPIQSRNLSTPILVTPGWQEYHGLATVNPHVRHCS